MRSVPRYSLWLGHIGDARDVSGLHGAGICAIIDLAREELPVAMPRELTYCRFPIIDGGGNPGWLLRTAVETIAALLRAGVPTLVYCGACMSRTPAIAGAAIALVKRCGPEQGLAEAVGLAASDVSPALWSEIKAAMESQ